MSANLKRIFYGAARRSGACSVARTFRKGPIVLFYHGVEESIADTKIQTLHLSMSSFEKQIDYLTKHFAIISIDELQDSLKNSSRLDPASVVITFDDGYRNNRQLVLPYLGARNIPFALFVSTRHIDQGLRFPTYYLRASILNTEKRSATIHNRAYDLSDCAAKHFAIRSISAELKREPSQLVDRILKELTSLLPPNQWDELNERFGSDAPMNWDDVKYMHDQGVCIGSHCHDHFVLHRNQDKDDIETQLRESRRMLEDKLGECDYIAYPNGRISDICAEALDRVRAARYVAGFTTIGGEVSLKTDPFLLPRIAASTENIDRFVFTVNTSFRQNMAYRNAVGQS